MFGLIVITGTIVKSFTHLGGLHALRFLIV